MTVAKKIDQADDADYTTSRLAIKPDHSKSIILLAGSLAVMRMSKKLNPGQPGTKRLVSQYGTRLVCVRYRYDAAQGKQFKTVELIIEESPWQPPARPFEDEEMVAIRIEVKEIHWRNRVKMAGGKWNPILKLWEIPYGQVRKLGLTDRIQQSNVSDNGKSSEPPQQQKVSDNGKLDVSIQRGGTLSCIKVCYYLSAADLLV